MESKEITRISELSRKLSIVKLELMIACEKALSKTTDQSTQETIKNIMQRIKWMKVSSIPLVYMEMGFYIRRGNDVLKELATTIREKLEQITREA